jgi:hypothetical protein
MRASLGLDRWSAAGVAVAHLLILTIKAQIRRFDFPLGRC